MRHPSEYTLTLLPPSTDTDGMWYGYARDGQHSPGGSDDVTPNNVKARGYGSDIVADDLWHQLRDYVEELNGEEAIQSDTQRRDRAPAALLSGGGKMNPRRFRLRVADHIGTHGTMTELRAINGVATALGWLNTSDMTTATAPLWLDRYRDLVAFRNANLKQAEEAEARAAVCSDQLEALADAHA